MNCPRPRCPPPRLTSTRRGNTAASRQVAARAITIGKESDHNCQCRPSSSAISPHPPIGGGGCVPAMGKHKAAMAGKPDPKNIRHALGDIGDVEANNRPPGDIANVVHIRAAEG
ncbi:hypothetical protein ZWY2020_057115 [Hordeum vulgare]|nr:hypothetical protein ZWY2020_057115 [Hordeum vulgare]